MNVHLERVDDAFHFRGTNGSGAHIDFDLTEDEGGANAGFGPMQAVAAALGGCSAVDVVLILRKGRQPVEDFAIDVEYERAQDLTPAVFTRLHVHFHLTGALDAAKVRRAVALSVEKYCSVAKMLEKTAEVTWGVTINGEPA